MSSLKEEEEIEVRENPTSPAGKSFSVTVLQPLPSPGSVSFLAGECDTWAPLVLRDAALLLGW